jgi:hypothetical protein
VLLLVALRTAHSTHAGLLHTDGARATAPHALRSTIWYLAAEGGEQQLGQISRLCSPPSK